MSLTIENNYFSGDAGVLAGLSKSATFRIYPNSFTTPTTPPQVQAANMDSAMLAAYLASSTGHLLKRQQSSTLQQGEDAIKAYCPLDGGVTKEIVIGCVKGLQIYCSAGSPMWNCHNYYNQALRNSNRYSPMGANCPPWRAGPVSANCTTDINGLTSKLSGMGGLTATDIAFPKSLNDNVFKNATIAPCSTGAYPNLVCASRALLA
jgi:hypothetical protein